MVGPLLTPREVAEALRIPLKTVWRYGREGPLRSAVVRVGGHVRFRADLVAQFVEAGGSDPRRRRERVET